MREGGEDTEHAEDVEDGLLQDLDDNGVLPTNSLVRRNEPGISCSDQALVLELHLFERQIFTGYQDYLFTKRYNLSPSSSLLKALFLNIWYLTSKFNRCHG